MVKEFPDLSFTPCVANLPGRSGGRKASLKSLGHPGVKVACGGLFLREPGPSYPTKCDFQQDLARGDRS